MSVGTSCLILSPSSGFGGGIERVSDAVISAWPGPVARVDLYRVGRNRRPGGGRVAKVRLGLAAAAAVVRRRPDHILCMHAGMLPAAVVLGALAHRPVTLFGYGTEVWAPMPRWERVCVGRCRRVVAISGFTAEWLARRAELSPSRVTLLRLPIAPSLAQAATAINPLPPSGRDLQVITVARLDPEHRYKGQFRIAEAWPTILTQHPGARWLVVGGGDDVDALARRCRELGIEHAVEIRSSVSDGELAAAYAQSRVHALPSTANVHTTPPTGEGFGLAYAEAGAFAVPSVAAFESGGAADIVEHDVTGLCSPDDPKALADAILRLLEDEELCDRLGAASRMRVLEHHLPEQFVAAVRQMYDT